MKYKIWDKLKKRYCEDLLLTQDGIIFGSIGSEYGTYIKNQKDFILSVETEETEFEFMNERESIISESKCW